MSVRRAAAGAVLLALAGCGGDPVQPGAEQPFVRHLLFTSGDRAVVGETLYVTSQVINDGPGDVYWRHGDCEPPFVIAMGDTARVLRRDPVADPCDTVHVDTIRAGTTVTEVLAFEGSLWDTLGAPFAAPDGRYVVRRTVAYARRADLAGPIALPRGVEFVWVVP